MTDMLKSPEAGQRKVQTFKFGAVCVVLLSAIYAVCTVITKGTLDANLFMVAMIAVGGTKLSMDSANTSEHKSKNGKPD